ncbi:hypothetical protein [Haloarcula salinisoli]|uniref:Uncharacterized protein n=1 Tax=Haloarcula salinisoli TaxID=2487746 RepID=A0A8J8C9S7_9EURY|nr:hypothetical protein [Halomicroarcula salinisoli]MBX0305667.1 hypothetical protein [Halomicroarcula salinisoli]
MVDRSNWDSQDISEQYNDEAGSLDPEDYDTEKWLTCHVCNIPLVAVDGPFDEMDDAVDAIEEIRKEQRYAPHVLAMSGETRCPKCHGPLGQSASDQDYDGDESDPMIAFCPPCDDAWVVTREKMPDEAQCPQCEGLLSKSDSGQDSDGEEAEYIIAHCPPCDGDWIVTTEKMGGKISGLIGGNVERTRLTCPYCGESFIVK